MLFKAYYKSKVTGEVESRECVRVDEKEGVVWLKNGGWLLLENVYFTLERASNHQHETLTDSYRPKPEDERRI